MNNTTQFHQIVVLSEPGPKVLGQPGMMKLYTDLDRLLEPKGCIVVNPGSSVELYLRNDFLFTANSKDPEISIKLLSTFDVELNERLKTPVDKEAPINHPPAIFVFRPRPTEVRFKYFEEKGQGAFQIYDNFNEEWRRFFAHPEVFGRDVRPDTMVTVPVHTAPMGTTINLEITNSIIKSAFVDKEGNLGVIEEFSLDFTHPIFEYVTLVQLPIDHPNIRVVDPATRYRGAVWAVASGLTSCGNAFLGGETPHPGQTY